MTDRTQDFLDPMSAALALTAQADALPRDPHQAVTAAELMLRREAHLQLCMTPEFRQYRQRLHARHPNADLREEWRQPSGDLVRKLAAQRRPARRIVLVSDRRLKDSGKPRPTLGGDFATVWVVA